VDILKLCTVDLLKFFIGDAAEGVDGLMDTFPSTVPLKGSNITCCRHNIIYSIYKTAVRSSSADMVNNLGTRWPIKTGELFVHSALGGWGRVEHHLSLVDHNIYPVWKSGILRRNNICSILYRSTVLLVHVHMYIRHQQIFSWQFQAVLEREKIPNNIFEKGFSYTLSRFSKSGLVLKIWKICPSGRLNCFLLQIGQFGYTKNREIYTESKL
jgi:hypothetical protein